MDASRPRRLPIALALFLGFWLAAPVALAQSQRISSFGRYEGYNEKAYDSYVRSSEYVEMRDGVRIAVDVMRPARRGIAEEKPLPAVWSHTRYRRANEVGGGRVQCAADSPMSFPLIEHGYVLVVADVRGSGASFGTWKGIFTEEETLDSNEITEWIAAQEWCDGNVGMTGGSYLGITQLMAASTHPPALKALFPMVALYDLYDTAYHGGVYFDDFLKTWSDLTWQLDTKTIAVGVDEDRDGSLLKAAIAEHQGNRALVDILGDLPFRDSQDDVTEAFPFRDWQPRGFTEEINDSEIPIYIWCGWFDTFAKDAFHMYRVYTAPHRVTMGAWSHSPRDPFMLRSMFDVVIVEQLRWFDHWLKGIDNGIMNDEPVVFHTMVEPRENVWRQIGEWPPPEARPVTFYFQEGPSQSVASSNDGLLGPAAPTTEEGADVYTVDYTTTSGTTTRWDNAVGGGFGYPDMTPNDEKALTYTTPPFKENVEVTGHPVVTLWVSVNADDADFFVFLEEVDENGHSHYVTEGTLRASHRKLHEPEEEGIRYVPYHRSYREDIEKLTPGEPVALVIDLQPTSTVFNEGHRLRVTICGADADNADTPKQDPASVVTLYRDAERASSIVLPIVSQADGN